MFLHRSVILLRIDQILDPYKHKSIHTIQTMPYNTSHKQIPLCQKNLLQIDSNKILHMQTHYTLDEISFKNIYNDTYMTHLKNAIYTKNSTSTCFMACTANKSSNRKF